MDSDGGGRKRDGSRRHGENGRSMALSHESRLLTSDAKLTVRSILQQPHTEREIALSGWRRS
jgi:hypothetical protein